MDLLWKRGEEGESNIPKRNCKNIVKYMQI
jgi:hypothetical protein